MFKRILVPTDGSEITPAAVDAAIDLCRALGAELHAVSVKEPFPYTAMAEVHPVPPQEYGEAQERIARQRVQEVVDAARRAGVDCRPHTVEGLHPWEAIIAHADTLGCDLLVMASHGRRGLSALLLRSETQQVLTHSKIPVLIVR